MAIQDRIDQHHELHEVVRTALSKNPGIPSGRLSFELNDSTVVLRGVVGSYYQKQLAQESLKSLKGVRAITNDIEVVGP